MGFPERVAGASAVYERWHHDLHGPTLQELNLDPEVTTFLGGRLPAEAVDATSRIIEAHWDEHGFGMWAVMLDGRSVGFAGAAHPGEHWPTVAAATEVGWRLARRAWGRGLATDGARLAIAALPAGHRIISLIAPGNERSVAVARRLGLQPAGEAEHATRGVVVTVFELP